MSSFANTVQNAAPRNRELLAILEATDHAPPRLEHQKQYIADLDRDLNELKKTIQSLDKQREKELKEHESYRDSVMKRFAYKVARKQDKFEQRASKEEKEYLQVLQDSQKAQQREESVKAMREEALVVQSDLEKEVARHTQAQRDLDSLYDSLFRGPTSDFPEEDATERDLQVADERCNSARMQLESQQQAANLLGQATKCLQLALSSIEDALDHSRMDMFGGGSMSDFLERDALNKAERQVHQMQMLVLQAQRYSDQVADLPPVRISQGNLVSDVLFDNIFSDMEFHDKIKQSREEVRRCGDALRAQAQAAAARVRTAEAEMARLSEQRSAARLALQKARERIFERLSANGSQAHPGNTTTHTPLTPPAPPKDSGSREAPPPYTSY